MDLLWPAIGIGVIVGFIFFVLARHWQKVLRQYAWNIRRLTERVRDLEEMADPEFRRRLGEASPLPLEQVFTFTFRLNDRFWRDVLQSTEENLRFIREYGSFVGSVKLERWRSHTVATVAEVLPSRKETGWQMRSLDFYPDPARPGNALTLWELALEKMKSSGERPPSLELVLRENSIDLLAHLPPEEKSANGNGAGQSIRSGGYEELVLLRVPLDTNHLAEFRSYDPSHEGVANNGDGAAQPSWHAFYSGAKEELGIDWQLRLRDLNKKSQWDRWKILEPAVPVGAEPK